jgi:hypothetical protein
MAPWSYCKYALNLDLYPEDVEEGYSGTCGESKLRVCICVVVHAQTVDSACKLQEALDDVADALKRIWQAKENEVAECGSSQKPCAETCGLMQKQCEGQDPCGCAGVCIRGHSIKAYHKDDCAAHLTLPDVSWEPVAFQVCPCTSEQYLSSHMSPAHHPDVVPRADKDLGCTSMPLTNQDAVHVDKEAPGACQSNSSLHRPSIKEAREGTSRTVVWKCDSSCALGKRESCCSVVHYAAEAQGTEAALESEGADLGQSECLSNRRSSSLLTSSTHDLADVHISCVPVTLSADYREMVHARQHDASQHTHRGVRHHGGAANCHVPTAQMRHREATQQMCNMRLAQTIDCRTGIDLNASTPQGEGDAILAASSDLETRFIATHIGDARGDAEVPEVSEVSSENYAHMEEIKWAACQEDACINPQAKREDSQQLSATCGVLQYHVVDKLRHLGCNQRNNAATRDARGCLRQTSGVYDKLSPASTVENTNQEVTALLAFLKTCSEFIEK